MKALENPRCPECRGKGEILWTTGRSQGFLKEAVLVFRLPDGRYSFPGTNQARTPKGAERLELRSAGEVRAVMREYNAGERSRGAAQEERYLEVAEQQQSARRATLHHLMGRESDPTARDLYREALERAHYEPSPRYLEVYNEAVE